MQTRRTPIIDTLTLWTGSLQAALAAGAGAAILADLPNWVAFSIAVGLFVVGMVQAGLRWAAQNATVPVGDVVEVREGSDVVAGPANDQVAEGAFVRELGRSPRHHVAD
ncbi:hypothetical protein [Mycobacterium tuberculosis]|uniref:hypothetical protein n=1 Tax=Mycobacterium tuberculosis TaxID=1773 RepID=UPI0011275417